MIGELGRRNIELKAKVGDMESARRVVKEVATSEGGVLEQVDTYFQCATGRLKLREIRDVGAELIWYVRADASGARASDYQIVKVGDGPGMKALLTAAAGVRAVVAKRRELFFYENVRIHLDEVEGLGTFLEFEAVLTGEGDASDAESTSEEIAAARLEFLREAFGIGAADLMADSYGDRLSV